MVRVDDKTYQWLGLSGTFPTQANMTGKQITPTQTIFKFSAGPAEVTATFLSPVEVTVVCYLEAPPLTLPKPRGSILSNNLFLSRMLHWTLISLMVWSIMYRFTWTSVEVRRIWAYLAKYLMHGDPDHFSR